MKALLVISHYSKRSKDLLNNLIKKLEKYNIDILVSINDDSASEVVIDKSTNIYSLVRPNIGMNIGGWNDGYKYFKNYDYYIFIQDECLIIRDDFIERYIEQLSLSNIGMIGESMNKKWDKTWKQMLISKLNYPSKINGLPRVNYYIDCMKKWNVNIGNNAKHLRALIWGFNNQCISKILNFPIGENRDECIAAEIAVSKLVEQNNFKFTQISSTPFTYITHIEWLKYGKKNDK